MKKLVTALLIIALPLGLLAGCGSGNDNGAGGDPGTVADSEADSTTEPVSDSSGTDSSGPVGEKVLTRHIANNPTTIDSAVGGDMYGGYVVDATQEPLLRVTYVGDGNYEYEPAGAASWESNDEGTEWTFHLNETYWEDGVQLTAHDYVYGMQRAVDPTNAAKLGYQLEFLKNFEGCSTGALPIEELGVEALDDMTLQVSLEFYAPQFLELCSNRVTYPQRRDIIEEQGDKFGSEADYYISSGPFKLDSWTHNNQVVLLKNDQNWQADKVALDKVIFEIIMEASTYNSAFLNGELDYVDSNLAEWQDQFRTMDGVYEVEIISNRTSFLHFNTQDELFSNVNFRKAFALAVDSQEFLDMCFGGNHMPSHAFTPFSMTVGGVNYIETAGDMVGAVRGNNPSPREILLQGMEELGLGDDPSTLNIVFSMSGTGATQRTNGEYLQQRWMNELGVTVELDINEWGIYESNYENGDYQFGWMSWGSFYNDPGDLLSLSVSTTDQLGTKWSNPEFDSLISQATQEADDAKRMQLYIDAETILLEECSAWPLYNTVNYWFLKDRVQNFSEGVWNRTNYMWMDVTD